MEVISPSLTVETWEIINEEGNVVSTYTAYIEFDPETKLFVGTVPGFPGTHTQAATLDELQANLKEVIQLCLEEHKGPVEDHPPRFVGIQQIEVA